METVIEIGAPPGRPRHGCPVLCTPLGVEYLIPRINVAEDIDTTPLPEAMHGLPEIPGHRVSLDVSKRRLRIYHPLADPRNAERLSKIQDFMQRAPSIGRRQLPPRDVVHENLTDEKVREWATWMQVVIQGEHGVLLQGELPPKDLPKAKAEEPAKG